MFAVGGFTSVGECTGAGLMIDKDTGAALQSWKDIAHVNGNVFVVKADGNGGWIIGGSFTYVGGQPHNRLARILPNGRVDNTFNPQFDGEVYDIIVTPSKIFVAGAFDNVNLFGRSKVAAINLDGTVDMLWIPPVLNAAVRQMAMNTNYLYLVGDFTTPNVQLLALNKSNGTRFIGWSPSVNRYTWIPIATPQAYGGAYTIAYYNSRVYVGGVWNSLGGVNSYLEALNENTGAADALFNPNIQNIDGGVNQTLINRLEVDNGVLYIAGAFNMINSESRITAAAIDLTTRALTNFNPQFVVPPFNVLGYLMGSMVRGFSFTNTSVFMTGSFQLIGSLGINGFAEALKGSGAIAGLPSPIQNSLYSAGGLIFPGFGYPNAGDSIFAVAADYYNPTKYYIGGDFSHINGVRKNHFVEFNLITGKTTNLSVPFDIGAATNVPSRVLAFSNKLAFMTLGTGLTIGGVAKTGVAIVDRTIGVLTSFDMGINTANKIVRTIEKDGDSLYVAGLFGLNFGGFNRTNLARFNVTTVNVTLDSWAPSVNDYVYDLEVAPDRIFVCGSFTNVNSFPRIGLVALEKTTSSLHSGFSTPAIVGNISLLRYNPGNGLIYVHGAFSSIGGQSRASIAALNMSGSVNASFNPNLQNDVHYFDPSFPLGTYTPITLLDLGFIGNNLFIHSDILNLVNGILINSRLVHLDATTGSYGTLNSNFGPSITVGTQVSTLNGKLLLPSGTYGSKYRTGFSFMSMTGSVAP
jgi:hypothetical protein